MSDAVTVVDYGVGNVGSLRTMLLRADAAVSVASSPQELATARRIVLPGVGAFDHAMTELRRTGFAEAVVEKAEAGVPLLGICIGLHLLTRGSEEGALPGLGLLPSRVRRFREVDGLHVPHMGWSRVAGTNDEVPWDGERYYFMHSFHVDAEATPDDLVLGLTRHGDDFPSVVGRDHVLGVQFHPEKSQRGGRELLRWWSSA